MMVFRSLEEARGQFGPCALAVGNFDGVHVGHQALLAEMTAYASRQQLAPGVLTFHPHPIAIVAPERLPPLICSLDQRIRLLAASGARCILILPFTQAVAHLSPEAFVSEILVNALETKAVFVGENFRFGHKRKGTPATLQSLGEQLGFYSKFLPPVKLRGQVVSSSGIRQLLAEGKVARAARLLGRCFSLEGPVVPGHGIGSKQTVPTLNIRPDPGVIIPRGVYVTETIEPSSGRCWPSITNAGYRPTFNGNELTVETFLLAALDDKTPHQIAIKFHHFVRTERAFPTPDALKAQILRDVTRAKRYWERTRRFDILRLQK